MGHSVALIPGGYPPNNYAPPPNPISQQAPYEPHGGYPSQPKPLYIASYSLGLPAKKKSTRASQACDQCRQLKAKCDETKPCQTCRDKGLECNMVHLTTERGAVPPIDGGGGCGTMAGGLIGG